VRPSRRAIAEALTSSSGSTRTTRHPLACSMSLIAPSTASANVAADR
jgi:hypothetical protein